MKIGYVTTTLESANGGWGRYSKSLIETLSDNHDVVVLTEKEVNNDPLPAKVKVVRTLPSHNGNAILAQVKVFIGCFLYLRKCEIIHALVEPFSPGIALFCFLTGKKLVITLHGTYSNPAALSKIMRNLMSFALRRATLLTTGSLNTEEKAREFFTFNECRFIPNGVDDKVFKHTPSVAKENFILTVGAVKERKGADIVIDALALIKDEFPLLSYKIVGDKGKDSYVTKLTEKISGHHLEKRVEFVGNIDDAALVELYNRSLVFILAARNIHGHFEGFPMVFYEANLCGTPVISTKGFGSEYAIKNGHNGYVVNQDSPQEIADTLRLIFRDKELYNKLLIGSIQEGERHIWKNIRPQLENLYSDALHS